MIALASGCLVFELASGESLPCSPEMISVEIMGQASHHFDEEFIQDAANGVFHYFKHELGKQSVTVGEFAGALEKVLQGFSQNSGPGRLGSALRPGVIESDLRRLARESGDGCELFFFPRLRDELRQQLLSGARILRFSGLRGCVMQLTGVRRRTARCRELEEQIVHFLRECLSAEVPSVEVALVVE